MEVIYSNAQRIAHSKGEFCIDFHQLNPENPNLKKSEPLVRVYMNPETIMMFRETLERNVGRFIDTFLKPKKEKGEESDK